MSNTPKELEAFPFEIMDEIRKGNLSAHNNVDRKKWMEQLSAWLFTLTDLDTEFFKQFKFSGIDKDRTCAQIYTKLRRDGASVSGAKLESERDEKVLEARKKEIELEAKSKYVHQIAKDTVENINVIKAAMKHEAMEGPYGSGQPS